MHELLSLTFKKPIKVFIEPPKCLESHYITGQEHFKEFLCLMN